MLKKPPPPPPAAGKAGRFPPAGIAGVVARARDVTEGRVIAALDDEDVSRAMIADGTLAAPGAKKRRGPKPGRGRKPKREGGGSGSVSELERTAILSEVERFASAVELSSRELWELLCSGGLSQAAAIRAVLATDAGEREKLTALRSAAREYHQALDDGRKGAAVALAHRFRRAHGIEPDSLSDPPVPVTEKMVRKWKKPSEEAKRAKARKALRHNPAK